ncbi:MAG: transglycosylase SLT domain-containing protein [Thermodesulfovibrio sp.]|nr:transglycosylase SLT domain-containing protein [Thermodesulfovibrio sp.]MDW7997842.1 transglycosylase SLT domain-containing protein [Thermodesulfovibrio sp.]
MKKFIFLFLLIFLSFSIPCHSEDNIPVLKKDEKKEVIFWGDEDFKLLPNKKENFIEKIEKNIVLFSEKIKEKFSLWLSRSTKYIEKMKEILAEKGLPEDLVYLPLIESGFNVNARSRAKAVGPWQFIESTAKRYGLIVDWWRDERKDPIKSTVAAANYLKDLYKMFGDWSLALAAYNAGEGRIYRALNKVTENDYWILLNTRYIPKETKNYVPRYIAAITIAKQPESFGFNNIEEHETINYEEIVIPSPTDLDIIAKCAQVDLNTIKELNPELKRWATPMNVKEYVIRIPEDKKEEFLQNFEKIPVEKRFSYDTYITKKGDTVQKIAKKTGFSVKVLYEMNGQQVFKNLKPETKIMIPPRDKFIPTSEDRFYEEKKSSKKGNLKNKKLKVNKTKKTKTKSA